MVPKSFSATFIAPTYPKFKCTDVVDSSWFEILSKKTSSKI